MPFFGTLLTTRLRLFLLVSPLLLPLAAPAAAQDLTELSFGQLLKVEVTSAAKQPQGLYETSAAVFVITNEDIERSGVTSIPEALRMVPGLQVARIKSGVWAISARGFNGRYANKLLVMIDGRTLYTPLFGGIYWDVQDTLLEDIERIEVVRGPTAALWGANAVNGVINIVTRRSDATLGTLVSGAAGSEERFILAARHGLKLGGGGYLRLFGKALDRDASAHADGSSTADDWRMQRGGFRYDWLSQQSDQLRLSGEIYRAELGETFFTPTFTPPYFTESVSDTEAKGGHLLGRWTRRFSVDADLALQLYFDHSSNEDDIAGAQERNIYDLDFQHRFAIGTNQQLLWGAGLRRYQDQITPGANIDFVDRNGRIDRLTGFFRYQIKTLDDRLRMTLGSHFEHNDFADFEAQPTLRMLWAPNPYRAIWGAVSKAVRTPTRAETSIIFKQATVPPENEKALPALPVLVGNDSFESEDSWSFEFGYRQRPIPSLFFDLSLFYTVYDGLLSGETGEISIETDPTLHARVQVDPTNTLDAESYGAEFAVDWFPLENWQLLGAYTFFKVDFELTGENQTSLFVDAAGAVPQHQLSLRSRLDLGEHWSWDLWLRLVDNLPTSAINGYASLDTRLAWQARKYLRLELIGQNLTDPQHPEYTPDFLTAGAAQIERSLMARLSLEF